MSAEKTRISKAPEERKQEIMDRAMQVFAEKGYEHTTMRDIAAAVGVVPGLCYRYFESKQDLFDAAVRQYVSDFCSPVILALNEHRGDFGGAMSCIFDLFANRTGRENYHAFFHKPENRTLHLLLNSYNCDFLLPHMKDFFDSLNEAGTADIPDTLSFSRFLLYGQIPVLEDETIPIKQRMETLRGYISRLLR